MSAMVVPQPYTRQHAFSTSRNLLNLDCSSDLKSYRRDLGPGVQAKCFEKTSDTIRAQLDEHRAFLLRHRQSGQASGFPSPVPRLEVPPSHTAPGNDAGQSQPNNNYHTTSHPRPLQILSQPYAAQQTPPASRPQSPVRSIPGQVATYPIDLRQALERATQFGHRYEQDNVYQVIVDAASNYMDGSTSVAGAHEDLQKANLLVANIFIFDGYYESGDEPTYEVDNIGRLRISIETDGPTGGYTTIRIQKAPVRRDLGPRRR